MPDDDYTHGHHASVLTSHSWRTAMNSAGYLLPHLLPGQRLLDVGCGIGTITADLADRVAPGPAVGIDRSRDVIEQAAVAVERSNLTFSTADLYALDYPDGSFDVVHAHQVLQHLTDPVAALREMVRVTAPGGIVAVRDADYRAMAYYPQLTGIDRFFQLYQRVARFNGAEPDAGRHLLAWAHAAGQRDVAVSASAWCYATPEDRAWWGGTWADRARESGVAVTALAQGFATEGELAEYADAWREWARHDDAWFAVTNGELIVRVH